MTRGVYVFCGWANPRPECRKVPGVQCPDPRPWKFRTRDRQPALGYYDERTPSISKWRIEQMRRGGVDFAIYQVGWSHLHAIPELMPRWERAKGALDPLLYRHCADAHSSATPRFCLSFFEVLVGDNPYNPSYWADRRRDGWRTDTFVESVRRFAVSVATHMRRREYYRIDGRPVFFWGYPQWLSYARRPFAIEPDVIVDTFALAVQEAGGGFPYIVATAVDPVALPHLKVWGFDAFTQYLWYADSWRAAMNTYRAKWREGLATARAQGIGYWIPATAGFDARAWGVPNAEDGRVPFMPTPEQFTAHLREAQQVARSNSRLTRDQVVTYAWNEFGEGGIIEPMKPGMLHDGDEMLRAFRAAA